MGEFAQRRTVQGTEQVLKLGTIDDFRYVRRQELEAWQLHDADPDTIQAYLDDPNTLYRFPWSNEDGQQIGDITLNDRDMFRTVQLRLPPVEYEHGKITVHLQAPKGGYQHNVWFPCLHHPDFDLKKSIEDVRHVVTIFGERYDEQGRGRTIFLCGYCKVPFSIGPEHMNNKLIDRIKPRPVEEERVEELETLLAQVDAAKSERHLAIVRRWEDEIEYEIDLDVEES